MRFLPCLRRFSFVCGRDGKCPFVMSAAMFFRPPLLPATFFTCPCFTCFYLKGKNDPMHFGFSYTGACMLLMLFVPNLIWTKNKPSGYDRYAGQENKFLLAFERIGEISVSVLCVIFSDFNPGALWPRSLWLVGAFLLMILYEIFWIRYFRSSKTMQDFYSSFLGIPVAGATLPVLAFFLLAIYGKNIVLGAAVVLLGIGHIGIHLGHRHELGSK